MKKMSDYPDDLFRRVVELNDEIVKLQKESDKLQKSTRNLAVLAIAISISTLLIHTILNLPFQLLL